MNEVQTFPAPSPPPPPLPTPKKTQKKEELLHTCSKVRIHCHGTLWTVKGCDRSYGGFKKQIWFEKALGQAFRVSYRQ